ncbi:hypothetical protein PG997_008716 [Apiospora hydei]|uniref:Uncharacterized protein n=1 Tax=Apiospora hydei TaxID=1337664 RepID=A0ABR1WFM1_9PEZI
MDHPLTSLAAGIWKNALRPWIWEIALCVTSSGLLVAIIAILVHANGHAQEEWSLQITLNSLINILSTLFRACLAATAAEVISQQKWIWFWSAPPAGRPILQVRTFEEASRSSLGALRLLATVSLQQPFIVFPIAIVLSSLAVGPFAQQSIRTVYQEMPSGLGTASLATSNYMNATLAQPSDGVNWSRTFYRTLDSPDYAMWSFDAGNRSVMLNAIANPASKDSVISPVCPTGNCSFPILSSETGVTHTSIGVCNTCTDVGSLVQNSTVQGKIWNRTITYTLPNGLQLILGDSTPWLSLFSGSLRWAERVMNADAISVARWAFVNTTVLTMSLPKGVYDREASFVPRAVACSLYPCLRSYAAGVRGNELSEVVVDSTPLVPDITEGYNDTKVDVERVRQSVGLQIYGLGTLAAIQPACRVDNSTYSLGNASLAPGAKAIRLLTSDAAPDYPTKLASEGCVTRIETMAYLLMGGAYRKVLNGTCSWLAEFWARRNASVQTITNRFDAIAGATTNQIRQGFLRASFAADRVEGTALRQVAYTRVEWAWLVLPAALLGLDILMMLCMILRSVWRWESEAVWKSDPLPLLYYKGRFIGPGGAAPAAEGLLSPGGFEPDGDSTAGIDRDEYDKLLTSAEMADVAKRVKVQFRKGAGKVGNSGLEGQPADEAEETPTRV